MKAGRKICNQVLDDRNQPVAGACVVLNMWHVHSNSRGFFDWAVEAPLPNVVELKVYKRYSRQYETLKKTVPLSQIEREPIILRRKK